MLALFKSSPRYLVAVIASLIMAQVFGHGMSDAEKQAIIEGGNLHYMWIGATHMLSGYDHLAFIFGVVFFLTRFRDVVSYITAFTLGHSVTLVYATFTGVSVNYFLIDAVIALSVCYIAFVNLNGFEKYFNIKAPNMIAMILGLGLIHGLGLSTRLQQLPLSEDNLLMNIISFNVGIEFGQVVALALMLVVIIALRKTDAFSNISRFVNGVLIFTGAYLFLMQMHGYQHTAFAEVFVPAESAVRVEGESETASRVWKETVTITLPAKGETEYKLYVEKGKTFEYSWSTNGESLLYDFHAEPAGDTSGYFKSFKEGTGSEAVGIQIAPFSGAHGWYWKNTSSSKVAITLRLNGEYLRLD